MSFTQKCAGCKNLLPKREQLKCKTCNARYDLDCANVSSKLFNLMEKREQWKCPECLCKRPKLGNTNTPIRSSSSLLETKPEDDQTSDVADQNVTLRAKVSRPPTESSREQDEHVFVEPGGSMVADLKVYMADLIKGQTSSIREAITNLTDIISAQSARIEQLEARVVELENKAKQTCYNDTTVLQSTISQLQVELTDREQSMLANDIEIAGYPETPNENCTHLAVLVANKIGVVLEEGDVVSAERAGPPRSVGENGAPARPRPIAVRLVRRASRDELLQSARVRRDLNTEGLQLPGPLCKLYVNERLTKHHRLLFQKARALARDTKYKFVWTRDGKVFVRQEQGKPRHRLRSETDLIRIFGKCNV